jgi:hypothetical protein
MVLQGRADYLDKVGVTEANKKYIRTAESVTFSKESVYDFITEEEKKAKIRV